MNRKEHEREKLLAETFHGEWLEGPAATFAQQAARLARQRRRQRRAFLTFAMAAGAAAALLVSLRHPLARTETTTSTPHSTPAYEIISDEELLAQLHDRPLLVMRGENGAKEFVLLDR
ncbi:MAG TPA: hypothetical protein VHO24_17560 [Opitutaceae bacterium]|nr:hypothetical protein [Opitutaceae bacterium]